MAMRTVTTAERSRGASLVCKTMATGLSEEEKGYL
jgi:hypothetical protein